MPERGDAGRDGNDRTNPEQSSESRGTASRVARLTRRSVLRTAGAAGAAGTLLGRATAAPGEAGCPGGGDGASPPPGPPALYDQPATAPQFENDGPWEADPLRVSGADAYVDGEYLFQDFIYDDHGANTTPTQTPPDPRPNHHTFGPMTGDVVYPTDRGTYVHNAADLLEFRARLTPRGRVHYRITLNSMVEPDAAAVAIGIDRGSGGDREWGYGLGDLGTDGLDHVLVTWGTGAELDGEPLSDVSVDTERNQIDVVLPLEPGGETWRHYLVTGLWDADDGAFKQIRDQPSEDEPGGAHGQDPPPVFNVGFRYNDQEPIATPNAELETAQQQLEEAIEEGSGSRGIGYGHWREHAQARALEARDISEFHADLDFSKLDRGVTEYDVPETGYFNRIYASNYDLEHDGQRQGIGPYVVDNENNEHRGEDDNNGEDVILGRLVPYSLYVPESYDPADPEPTPFHVHLHSLSGTYNQYRSWTPNFLQQLGEERDTIIMTATGRGPGVPYDDQAELDVFEAWGDAAARYCIDFDRVTVGGYSMGGIGTHRLASKWPDLFARGFSIAGSVGDAYTDEVFGDDLYKNQELIAINQRHVPLLSWHGPFDELAPLPFAVKYHQHLRELGLRHEFDVFPAADHLTFGYLDEWGPAAEFLDGVTVERSPPRITYRSYPKNHNYEFDLVHDGAYWVSDIAVADGAAHGLVDVRSLGFGEGEPVVVRYEREGTEPKPHVKRGVEWEEPASDPAPANALELDLEDVSAVTVWVDEAELDAREPIELVVDSTTAATITLVSALGRREVDVPAGHTERTVHICGRGPAGATPRVERDGGGGEDGAVAAGAADEVAVSVDAGSRIRVRDRLPEGWTVPDGAPHRTYEEDGTRYVEFADPVREGTRAYSVEAPAGADAAGRYTFGPVEVNAGDGWLPVAGTTGASWVAGTDADRD